MPIIGSISGSFGFGRSPQTSPPPGFTIYPPIGSLRTWSFSSNGTCVFDGNNTSSATGNVFVITPTTTFVCNVKIWGAGGGGANLVATTVNNPVAGSGGATYGQVLLKVGQPYTIFSGGAGNVMIYNPIYAGQAGSGGGGSASGILQGNLYADTTAILPEIAIAGGGGGAINLQYYYGQLATAGGGFRSQYGPAGSTIRYGGVPVTAGSGAGIPFPISYAALSLAYTGGYPNTTNYAGGGGGAGSSGAAGLAFGGGNTGHGGTGYAIPSDLELSTAAGVYGLPPLYDDTLRSTAGDSDSTGRVVLFLDEYQPTTIVATGGTVTDVPIPGQTLAYRYHTFSSNEKFVVTSAALVDKVDVIATGGGGGGDDAGGGGGGGGVVIRNGLPIGVGTYNVTVGQGGARRDSYGAGSIGGIYGAYRGTDSAFFTNTLAAKSMPDNYWRLINSFGARIIYVSLSGSDTVDSGSFTTPYASIEYAIAAVASIDEMIVIVILSGTYTPVIGVNSIQTPIDDGGKPRIFICSPSKVIINYTPVSLQSSPVAVLSNNLSAVYGAIFVRNMFNTTDDRELAFFNNSAQPGSKIARGNFYNCVFKEALGKWALVYGNNTASFKVENCTFYTLNAGLENAFAHAAAAAPRTLFKNCAFNKTVTTDAVLDNCVIGATISTKYVITGVVDKGVFAGEYAWGSAITVPERTAKAVAYVAIGGGGGGTGTTISYDSSGGSGGGGYSNNIPGPALQHNGIINPDYSGYGYRGGLSSLGYAAGGGGAMFPPLTTILQHSNGGLGIEWPAGSSTYYGTGGDAVNVFDVTTGLVQYGRGGRGGQTGTAGSVGSVAVRYIVQGTYTAPTITANVNILAYGGQIVRQVGNYREHIFTSSGTFRLANLPFDSKLDIVLVGGGGGGQGSDYVGSLGGKGGDVVYRTITTATISQISDYTISIGAGGNGGYSSYAWPSYRGYAYPTTGATSFITGAGVYFYATGGGTTNSILSNLTGTTINSGLYATNPVSYAGSGAPQNAGPGGIPGGGNSNYSTNYVQSAGNGTPGTGGGGGCGPSLNTRYNDWNYSYGGAGGSGAVVIRYPYTP